MGRSLCGTKLAKDFEEVDVGCALIGAQVCHKGSSQICLCSDTL